MPVVCTFIEAPPTAGRPRAEKGLKAEPSHEARAESPADGDAKGRHATSVAVLPPRLERRIAGQFSEGVLFRSGQREHFASDAQSFLDHRPCWSAHVF